MPNIAPVKRFLSSINQQITKLPKDFYTTFNYTITGRNLTHPITTAIVAKSAAEAWPALTLALDTRFNDGQLKFQPDLVGFLGEPKEENVCLVIDYESPNSSDYRVTTKDMAAYHAYRKHFRQNSLYIIITTLPNFECAKWQLGYTSFQKYNAKFKGRLDSVRRNPFRFWYSVYAKSIKNHGRGDLLSFMNMSGNRCMPIDILELA